MQLSISALLLNLFNNPWRTVYLFRLYDFICAMYAQTLEILHKCFDFIIVVY